MTSPINTLMARVKSAESLYKKLYKTYQELVASSIKLENLKDEYEEAISACCEGCSAKAEDLCGNCALHQVALSYDLWR